MAPSSKCPGTRHFCNFSMTEGFLSFIVCSHPSTTTTWPSSTMKEMNPSVVEKLLNALGPGRPTMVLGRNLFPSDFQDSLADKSSTGKDFATFVDCAKRALQSVHENNEIGLNEEALAKNIFSRCCSRRWSTRDPPRLARILPRLIHPLQWMTTRFSKCLS